MDKINTPYCYKHEAGWTDGLCWVIFDNEQRSIARVSDEPTADLIVNALNNQQPTCPDCQPKGELMPCPFCGNKASIGVVQYSPCDITKLNKREHGYFVNCQYCAARNEHGISYATKEEAIKHWNTRKGTQAAARVEELEKIAFANVVTEKYGWCGKCGALVVGAEGHICDYCGSEAKPFVVEKELLQQRKRIEELELQRDCEKRINNELIDRIEQLQLYAEAYEQMRTLFMNHLQQIESRMTEAALGEEAKGDN